MHVLELPPKLELSRFVNNVKVTSSRLIRREGTARCVREAGLLVPLVLHHNMRAAPH